MMAYTTKYSRWKDRKPGAFSPDGFESLVSSLPLLSATTATAATPTTDKLLTLDGVRRSLNQTCHRFILPRNPDLVLYCSYYYHCCCCCLFSANFYEIV